MREHYIKIQKYQEEVANITKQHEAVISLRDQEIQRLQAVNNQLRLDLDRENQKKDIKMQLDVQIEEKKKLIASCEELNLNIEFFRNESVELKKEVSEKLSIIGNMAAEIDKLKATNGVPLNDHRGIVAKIENKYSSLLGKSKEMQDIVSFFVFLFVSYHFLNKFLISKFLQNKSLTATITDLKTKLDDNETRNRENELTKATLESSVEVLKIQLETYKNDFEMERSCRQTIAGEKEQTLTELKLLQRRNEQLREELEKVKSGGVRAGSIGSQTQKRSSHSPSPNVFNRTASGTDVNDEQSFPKSFMCPICSKTFKALHLLQYHVDMCLGV